MFLTLMQRVAKVLGSGHLLCKKIEQESAGSYTFSFEIIKFDSFFPSIPLEKSELEGIDTLLQRVLITFPNSDPLLVFHRIKVLLILAASFQNLLEQNSAKDSKKHFLETLVLLKQAKQFTQHCLQLESKKLFKPSPVVETLKKNILEDIAAITVKIQHRIELAFKTLQILGHAETIEETYLTYRQNNAPPVTTSETEFWHGFSRYIHKLAFSVVQKSTKSNDNYANSFAGVFSEDLIKKIQNIQALVKLAQEANATIVDYYNQGFDPLAVLLGGQCAGTAVVWGTLLQESPPTEPAVSSETFKASLSKLTELTNLLQYPLAMPITYSLHGRLAANRATFRAYNDLRKNASKSSNTIPLTGKESKEHIIVTEVLKLFSANREAAAKEPVPFAAVIIMGGRVGKDDFISHFMGIAELTFKDPALPTAYQLMDSQRAKIEAPSAAALSTLITDFCERLGYNKACDRFTVQLFNKELKRVQLLMRSSKGKSFLKYIEEEANALPDFPLWAFNRFRSKTTAANTNLNPDAAVPSNFTHSPNLAPTATHPSIKQSVIL